MAKWAAFARLINELQEGDTVDVPFCANDTPSLAKMRGGIYAQKPMRDSLAKFLLHALPWGGVRLVRVGNFASAYRRIEAFDCGKSFHPPSRHKVELVDRPANLWLGLLWNSASKRTDFVARTCSEKGCPLPVVREGMCHHHAHFFDYPISMTDRNIDWNPHYRTGYDANQTPELYSEFLVSTASLEKSLRVERSGYLRHDHKNQGDGDILAEEVDVDRDKKNALARHAKARNKAAIRQKNIDVVTDEFLLEAARRATNSRDRDQIRRLFTVIPEPRVEYAPEQRVVNYQGRGTRGGHPGSHKKVRKSQRKRPAGWHGSRPDHDVYKRWSRETVEPVECEYDDVAFESDEIEGFV
jgi:hypothetical protein